MVRTSIRIKVNFQVRVDFCAEETERDALFVIAPHRDAMTDGLPICPEKVPGVRGMWTGSSYGIIPLVTRRQCQRTRPQIVSMMPQTVDNLLVCGQKNYRGSPTGNVIPPPKPLFHFPTADLM